jgi:hypothetical protein
MRRALIVIASCVVALLISVSPALGDTQLEETWYNDLGIGRNHLVDNTSKPGARCHWSQSSVSQDWWTMDELSVRPPKVFGTRNNQRVGWRFMVVRQKEAFSGEQQWPKKITYTSPIQNGIAQIHSAATFRRMSVPVDTPNDGRSYAYWVRVKMFWYQANGDIQGWSLHEADYYSQFVGDSFNGVYSECSSQQPPTG